MAIYCSNCGASLPDGVAFCDSCGNPVRGQQQQQPAMPHADPYGSSPSAAGTNHNQGMVGAGSVSCPVCGATALPGEAFCDNCGAALLPTYSNAPIQNASPVQTPQPASSPPFYSPAAPSSYTSPVAERTASLVIVNPPPPATLPVPDRAELIVGRSDPQSNSYPDIDLGPYGGLDMGVSRRHFRLSHTGPQFYIEDLNSVNGTVINGQRIPPHNLHPLSPGDRIALGKMEITFELG